MRRYRLRELYVPLLVCLPRLDHFERGGSAPSCTDPGERRWTVKMYKAFNGMIPQQFVDAASAAVGRQPGFFFLGKSRSFDHELSSAAEYSCYRLRSILG